MVRCALRHALLVQKYAVSMCVSQFHTQLVNPGQNCLYSVSVLVFVKDASLYLLTAATNAEGGRL